MNTENDRNEQARKKAPLGFYRHWIPSTKNARLVRAMKKHGTFAAFAGYCILIEELYISGEGDPQGGGRLCDTDIEAIAFKWQIDDEGMRVINALLDDSGLFVKDAGAYRSEEVDAGLADIAANRKYEREKKSKAKKGRQLPGGFPGDSPGNAGGFPDNRREEQEEEKEEEKIIQDADAEEKRLRCVCGAAPYVDYMVKIHYKGKVTFSDIALRKFREYPEAKVTAAMCFALARIDYPSPPLTNPIGFILDLLKGVDSPETLYANANKIYAQHITQTERETQ